MSQLSPFPFEKLLKWYDTHKRDHLPWRDYSFDEKTLPYRVWLSEIMLQQTQAERVKEYFDRMIGAFPTVESLATTSYEEFFPYYKGLGYYTRARNMLACAKKIIEEYDGVFPRETKDLIGLPGVGPYTAEAIRAFGYNIPTLSFDTNLEKIFSRYYFGSKHRKLTKAEKEIILQDFVVWIQTHQKRKVQEKQDLIDGSVHTSTRPKSTSKFDEEIGSFSGVGARDINNALMDFGALVSLNAVRNIDWENYPLQNSDFYLTRGELEPEIVKKKSSFPMKKAHIFTILHKDHKEYYSEYNDFGLFYIGKNTGNPRAIIQKYFENKYNLELSVRPPEVKSYNFQEVPYIVCYAQIQSGNNPFKIFSGLQLRGFEEGFIENKELSESLSLF